MRRLLVLLLALATSAVLPAAALGGTASIATVDFGTLSGRAPISLGHAHRFTLVGLHWRGAGAVRFRTRSLAGRWTGWRPASPEGEDGPDAASHEGPASEWHIGDPWWVGPSDGLEIRVTGSPARVRARLVWSPATRVPARALAAAGTSAGTTMPEIVSRAAWGANEAIRRNAPSYAPSVRFAIVHHTAGTNSYSRTQSAAVVRAIQLYHVRGNGWNDIGYNFLIDRFGTIYEGRYGGVDRNVIGAHALGFNTGSTGIALMGTYGDAKPSRAALDALTKLLAWRLDVAHVDPRGFVTVLSGGSERYPPNVPVLLRTVSGHRDTGFTECPGERLYGQLNAISAAAAKLGGPKIFGPEVAADAEGLVRFRARMSRPLTWAVVVSQGANEITRGTGTGTTVDWTWDATSLPPATYRWSISAGTARPATGSIRAGLGTTELAILAPSATPEGITPNGDGQADTATLSYTLTTAANVTVEVSTADGSVVSTPVDRVWTNAGTHAVMIDGAPLADGAYDVLVRARTTTSAEVVQSLPLTVSRTLGPVSVTPTTFSPNGDGRLDSVAVDFVLAAPATVTVRVLREDRWIAAPLQVAALQAGSQQVVWDGTRSNGTLRDGALSAVVTVSDEVGTVSYGVPFASDTTAPLVRVVPGRRPRLEVSEAAALKLWINGQVVHRDVQRAGLVSVPWAGPVLRLRVIAWDVAGNVSSAVVWRAGAGRG
jgi:hypothetical protein